MAGKLQLTHTTRLESWKFSFIPVADACGIYDASSADIAEKGSRIDHDGMRLSTNWSAKEEKSAPKYIRIARHLKDGAASDDSCIKCMSESMH